MDFPLSFARFAKNPVLQGVPGPLKNPLFLGLKMAIFGPPPKNGGSGPPLSKACLGTKSPPEVKIGKKSKEKAHKKVEKSMVGLRKWGPKNSAFLPKSPFSALPGQDPKNGPKMALF